MENFTTEEIGLLTTAAGYLIMVFLHAKQKNKINKLEEEIKEKEENFEDEISARSIGMRIEMSAEYKQKINKLYETLKEPQYKKFKEEYNNVENQAKFLEYIYLKLNEAKKNDKIDKNSDKEHNFKNEIINLVTKFTITKN